MITWNSSRANANSSNRTGSTASGETLCRRRGPSSSSEQSRGSPPLGIDRPLTVHKIRRGRGSLTDGSFDDPSESHVGSAISDLLKKQGGSFPRFNASYLSILREALVYERLIGSQKTRTLRMIRTSHQKHASPYREP